MPPTLTLILQSVPLALRIFDYIPAGEVIRLQGLNYLFWDEIMPNAQISWRLVKRQRYFFFTVPKWDRLNQSLFAFDAKTRQSAEIKSDLFSFKDRPGI